MVSNLLSGITPVCTGNTLKVRRRGRRPWDHPRMHGEYQRPGVYRTRPEGSPPYARGIRKRPPQRQEADRITPVCTGNTTLRRPMDVQLTGSPPYARGILSFYNSAKEYLRITPVCTGNTFIESCENVTRRDHPRMHGEYFSVIEVLSLLSGSPPYARGIH